MEHARTNVHSYPVVDGKKNRGQFHFKNASLRNHYTFIDLHVKNGLNIVPVVGVDFSLANLTFDEN